MRRIPRSLCFIFSILAFAPTAIAQERAAADAEEVTISTNGYTLAGTLLLHSEGGTIAMMVAAGDKRIHAIVLMAAMGKTGKEVNLAQQEAALADAPGFTEEKKNELREQQRQILKTIIGGGDTSKLPPAARLPWFKEFLTFDPLPLMRRVRQPVLILQGERDQQVTADQAGLLEGAAREGGNKHVTVHLFPTLNHLFLPATTGSVTEYSKLSITTIGMDVLDGLGTWLARQLRAGN